MSEHELTQSEINEALAEELSRVREPATLSRILAIGQIPACDIPQQPNTTDIAQGQVSV